MTWMDDFLIFLSFFLWLIYKFYVIDNSADINFTTMTENQLKNQWITIIIQKTITLKTAFFPYLFYFIFPFFLLNSISSSIVQHVSTFCDGIFGRLQLIDTTVIKIVPFLCFLIPEIKQYLTSNMQYNDRHLYLRSGSWFQSSRTSMNPSLNYAHFPPWSNPQAYCGSIRILKHQSLSAGSRPYYFINQNVHIQFLCVVLLSLESFET